MKYFFAYYMLGIVFMVISVAFFFHAFKEHVKELRPVFVIATDKNITIKQTGKYAYEVRTEEAP